MSQRSFQLLENNEKNISDLKKTRNELFNIPSEHFNWKDYYSISQIRKFKDLQKIFNLSENDLKVIVKNFIKWSKKPTYLTFQNIKTGNLIISLASKRGNKIYEHCLNKKLDEQLSFMKDKNFHKRILRNSEDFRDKRISNCFFITLTCDPEKYNNNRTTAWLSFEHDYNIFRTRLTKRFGKCWIMKSTESTQRGYPHIHLLVVTEKEAEVFSYKNKKGFVEYRLQEKKKLEKYWPSNIDVIVPNPADMKKEGCVNFMKDYIFKDMLKAYRYKDEREYKNYLTLALGWIFGKRCFSISDPAKLKLDLITDTSITQTQITDLLERLGEKEYKFIGFLDLKIRNGLNPPVSIEIRFDDPDYEKFYSAIYNKKTKEELIVVNKKKIKAGYPEISESNQNIINEVMKKSWINILKIEKIRPVELTYARIQEIKRMNMQEFERKIKIIPKQLFRKNIFVPIESFQLPDIPSVEDIEGFNKIINHRKLSTQARLNRVLDPKSIKLNPSEYIDLALFGKC